MLRRVSPGCGSPMRVFWLMVLNPARHAWEVQIGAPLPTPSRSQGADGQLFGGVRAFVGGNQHHDQIRGNTLHGDAYDYVQNDIFNANDFFSNLNGLPKGLVRYNDFGASLG